MKKQISNPRIDNPLLEFIIWMWILTLFFHALAYLETNLLYLTRLTDLLLILLALVYGFSPVNEEEKKCNYRFSGNLFESIPGKLKSMIIVSFIFAFINFGTFFYSLKGGGPQYYPEKNEYVLENHGNLIKKLSKREYLYYKRIEANGITGHLILFYVLAVALIYKERHRKKFEKTKIK